MQRPPNIGALHEAVEEWDRVQTISAQELVTRLQGGDASTLAFLGVWSGHPFQGAHPPNAQHMTLDAELYDEGNKSKIKQEMQRIFSGLSKDKGTLVVYSMYSAGRTSTVVKDFTTAASESGVELNILLLEGGLHAFVNLVCRGQPRISDKPGLIEGCYPENWKMTPCNGFVNIVEVEALAALRIEDGLGVQNMRRPPNIGALDEAVEEWDTVQTISAQELVTRLQGGDASTLAFLGVWSGHPFQGAHPPNAQHMTLDAELYDEGNKSKLKQDIQKIFRGLSMDKSTLVVYSMYSAGRTSTVVKDFTTAASENGVELNILLLEGGLHAFVNIACRGQPRISDKPGLIEGCYPENWKMTACNGFVNIVEVEALAALRIEDGLGVQNMRRPPNIGALNEAVEEWDRVETISAQELVTRLQGGDASTLAFLGVWSGHPFQGAHPPNAQHMTLDAELYDEGNKSKLKQDIQKIFSGLSKDKGTLVVYSMYSAGRTSTVVKDFTTAASENGVELNILLLEGGLHSFVNLVCRGQPRISDKPGLIEGCYPENWKMTSCNGFVNTVEVEALAMLRIEDGLAVQHKSSSSRSLGIMKDKVDRVKAIFRKDDTRGSGVVQIDTLSRLFRILKGTASCTENDIRAALASLLQPDGTSVLYDDFIDCLWTPPVVHQGQAA